MNWIVIKVNIVIKGITSMNPMNGMKDFIKWINGLKYIVIKVIFNGIIGKNGMKYYIGFYSK